MGFVGGAPGQGAHVVSRLSEAGASYLELVLALGIAAAMTGLAVPVTAHAIDAGRARAAAGFLASTARRSRQDAAMQGRTTALVFDLVDARWTFRVCRDGTGDGVRRTDVANGRDVCDPVRYDLAAMFPGVQVGVDATLPGPDGEPGSPDPVRFGRSNIASFSPEGTATAGALFLRSPRGAQYAMRISNVTGRTRILHFDPSSRRWAPE